MTTYTITLVSVTVPNGPPYGRETNAMYNMVRYRLTYRPFLASILGVVVVKMKQ